MAALSAQSLDTPAARALDGGRNVVVVEPCPVDSRPSSGVSAADLQGQAIDLPPMAPHSEVESLFAASPHAEPTAFGSPARVALIDIDRDFVSEIMLMACLICGAFLLLAFFGCLLAAILKTSSAKES